MLKVLKHLTIASFYIMLAGIFVFTFGLLSMLFISTCVEIGVSIGNTLS